MARCHPTAIVAEISDRLPREIGEDNIRKYFLLTDGDLQQVRRCRGNSNRLGFAVQLCTLRWRGYFLPDTSALPMAVLEFLAPQVKTEAVQIPEYPQNEKTRWAHLDRIRSHLRFEKCDEAQRQLLFNHLKTQALSCAVANQWPTVLVSETLSPDRAAIHLLSLLAMVPLEAVVSHQTKEADFTRLTEAADRLGSSPLLLLADDASRSEKTSEAIIRLIGGGDFEVVISERPRVDNSAPWRGRFANLFWLGSLRIYLVEG